MTTTEAKPATSPDDLLKAIVVAKEDLAEAPAKAAADAPQGTSPAAGEAASPGNAVQRLAAELRKTEPRLVAAASAALVLGAILGAAATSLAGSAGSAPNAAITSLATAIESGRTDTAKLTATVAKLEQTITDLRSATEAARREATTRGSVNEKLAQLDRSLTTKLAGLGERIDQAEREQANRISALANRPVAAKADAIKADAIKAEPTQTGSLAEPRDKVADKSTEAKAPDVRQADVRQTEAAKASPGKPPVLANYAFRDVFEGAAIIEGRNRRLYQVMPGDTLPGAGRVEGIERQGRTWVLVTHQGIVTPQPW